jgi:hypothetical protein
MGCVITISALQQTLKTQVSRTWVVFKCCQCGSLQHQDCKLPSVHVLKRAIAIICSVLIASASAVCDRKWGGRRHDQIRQWRPACCRSQSVENVTRQMSGNPSPPLRATVNQVVRCAYLLLHVSLRNAFHFQEVSSCVLYSKLCSLNRVQNFYVNPKRIDT